MLLEGWARVFRRGAEAQRRWIIAPVVVVAVNPPSSLLSLADPREAAKERVGASQGHNRVAVG